MHSYALRRSVGILVALLLLSALASAQAATQTEPSSSDLLTVDQAIKLAVANNRPFKIVSLNVDISKQQVLAAKTKRLPAVNTYVFASQLLQPISFEIAAGQFGTYKNTGPIPATNTSISTPTRPTAYIFGTVSQPLLSLYKINLGVRGQELSLEQSVLQLRDQRNTLVNNVRQAYYSVVEIENVIAASKASIKQYEELDRITLEYISQKVALQSDSLEVKAKLAQERLQLLQAEDELESAKETLNNLLARDLNVDFQVAEDKELSPLEQDLKAAQAVALEQHPKIKEAEIQTQQADTARRLAKAEYIPDVAASFHYLSPFGVNFLPTNIMSVGIEMSWEPWDWGRRKDVVNQKVLALEQSKLNLDETKSSVLVNLDNQFRTLQEARMAVDVASAQQQAAREKLREVTQQYSQKNALLRDVLQQQAVVEKGNADYNQAIASFWTAKANFQLALGEN